MSTDYSLFFDGVNDYIQVNLNEPETELTHELWFKTTNPNVGLFSVMSADNSHDRHLYLDHGNLYARIYNHELIGSTGLNLADGNWHHVAHTFGASVGGQKLYIDGQLVASGTKAQSDFIWQDKVLIGYSIDAAADLFQGQIDEVRIWNKTRTQAEIQADMNHSLTGTESGLIGYWQLNEGTGNTVADLSSNHNNGAIVGGATFTSGVFSPGTFVFSQPNFTIKEGGISVEEVTINRIDGLGQEVSVTVNLSNGKATAPNDYNNAPITVTFANGETEKTVTIPIVDDLQFEGNETLNITLTNATGGAIIGAQDKATLTIVDNEINQGITIDEGQTKLINNTVLKAVETNKQPTDIIYTLTDLPDNGQLILNNPNGKALSFNGVNDYIALGNPSSLQITGNQTLELWIKPTHFNYRQNPFNKAWGGEGTLTLEGGNDAAGAAGTVHYYYGVTGADWGRSGINYQGFNTNQSLNINQWSHLAVVRDFNNQKLSWYINGVKVNETYTLFNSATPSNNPIYIGTGYTNYFNGLIDEVRIWNKARTQAEIQADMNRQLTGTESGLVSYWNFNEGSGNTVTDLTNNHNNGTVYGATWTTGIVPTSKILNLGDTFTQADLDNGLLTYQHNGSQTTSDNFKFTLADVKNEFPVNTYTTNNQGFGYDWGTSYQSSIAALKDGGFVIVWSSQGQDGSDWGIYGQRYDINSNKIGSEFQINTYTQNAQYNPSIAALNSGGFVVVWASKLQDGSGNPIYGQRYDANGNKLGSEFQISTYTQDTQWWEPYPSVTTLNDGGFFVTWASESGDVNGNIYGQRYDANGNKVGTAFSINTYTDGIQIQASAITLNNGDLIVAWQSYPQNNRHWGLYGQRYDKNGNKLGNQFQIHSSPYYNYSEPRIAALTDGGFVVTSISGDWTANTHDGSGRGIIGQKFDSNGNKIGSEFQINTYTNGHQEYEWVTALGNGGFVVVWQSQNQDGSGYGIYGQQFDANCNKIGNEFAINQYTVNNQWFPAITTLADGSSIIVTWTSENQDGSGNGIYARKFNTSDPPISTFNITVLIELPQVSLTISPDSVSENGSPNLIYTFNRTGDKTNPLTVNFNVSGDAIWNNDYSQTGAATFTGNQGSITFAAGIDTVQLTINPKSDTLVEPHETIKLTLTSGTGYTINTPNPIIGTITNDDGDANNNELIGGSGNDSLSGLAGNDTIIGNAGNDTLNGGAGVDSLTGNTGNDTYIIDDLNDIIVENANEGTDIVQTPFNFDLTATNLENITLLGTDNLNATGNSFNNTLTGNSGNNLLQGLAGNDNLDGKAGNDTLEGGTGNDTYTIDAGDTIVENPNEGTDTVKVGFSYILADTLENLTLLGTGNFNGTGNSSNNSLTGNNGNNRLEGLAGNDNLNGGLGNDTLVGGTSNDTYTIDAGDTITENANEGTDSVNASFTYTLGDNLENLTLSGNAAINGTGNTLNNILNGNSGNNLLIGLEGNDSLDGKAGNDTLEGGAGDDTYTIDAGDTITENANAGTDTVKVGFASYTLTANFENLTLTGTLAIDGVGNNSNNLLTGNNAANTLTGLDGNDTLTGGNGNDTLTGGNGNDVLTGGSGLEQFVLNAPGGGIDSITDFRVIDDTLVISASQFGGGLTVGTAIDSSQFRIGAGATTATTADHRFIYNSTNGALFFDADGNAATAMAIQLATLSPRLALTASDFMVGV